MGDLDSIDDYVSFLIEERPLLWATEDPFDLDSYE